MKKNHSGLIIIVDKSGSMSCIANDTIGGINQYIEDQQKETGTAEFAIVQFDHEIDELVITDIKEAKLLTNETYKVRGSTALLDAIGKTITEYGRILAARNEDERPSNIQINIFTDGEENSSKEYSLEKIKELIKEQKEKYNWNFAFFGANIDSFATGSSYGFNTNLTTNYQSTSKGIRAAIRTASQYTSNVRKGVSVYSMNLSDMYMNSLNEEDEKNEQIIDPVAYSFQS